MTEQGKPEDRTGRSANSFSPRARISNHTNVRTQHHEVLLPVARVVAMADHPSIVERVLLEMASRRRSSGSSRLEPRIVVLLLQCTDVGPRAIGKWKTIMNKQLVWKMLFLLSLAMAVFAPAARSQEQPSPSPQAGSSTAKPQPPAEEPEADTSAATEALQNATQNPLASLVSVPVQNNNNFGVNPGYRTQDVLNIQPVIPIGISQDWNLLVRWIMPIVYQPVPNQPGTPETGEYGLGDMVPTFFISPKKPGKLIWGAGPVFQLPTATNTYLGQGEVGHRPIDRTSDATGPLDFRDTGKQCLVRCGIGQPHRCESIFVPILHQLQPEKGMVHHLAADADSELGSDEWKYMDRAVWRRNRKNHETGQSAGVAHCTVLWQRGSSGRGSVVDDAVTDRVSVSQAKQRTKGNVAGEKIETAGSQAAILNLALLRARGSFETEQSHGVHAGMRGTNARDGRDVHRRSNAIL